MLWALIVALSLPAITGPERDAENLRKISRCVCICESVCMCECARTVKVHTCRYLCVFMCVHEMCEFICVCALCMCAYLCISVYECGDV